MSDSVKRFQLCNEEDNEFLFSGSGEEWQSDLSCGDGKQQSVVAHSFLKKMDVLSNSLSSSPSDVPYNVSKYSPNNDNEPIFKSPILKALSRQRLSSTLEKTSQKKGPKKFYSLREVGRWKPSDDLLLLISVLQVNDLDMVFSITKFSCKFTYDEIVNRWNALLYDDLVSRTARSAIRKLHPEQQAAIHKQAPFSLSEEDLLCDLLSTDSPSIGDFQNLIEKNSGTFYHARTAKSLQKHWRLLQKYELLCDQRPTARLCAAGENPQSFSDIEAEVKCESFEESSLHGHVDQEIKLMDQQIKRKTRLLEDELGHWMQLLGTSTKSIDFSPRFDSKTFAILRGQRLRYAMRTRFISFGRLTSNGEDVDVDLSVEGPAHKVSRYQGGIELRDNGTFATCNLGKRAFFVDGKPVFPEVMVTVHNNSIFEVFGITFVFLINKQLVEDVCFNELDTD